MAEAVGWLERYRQLWEGRYQQLDRLLEELQPEKDPAFKPDRQ
jgi:hypothetical protein